MHSSLPLNDLVFPHSLDTYDGVRGVLPGH